MLESIPLELGTIIPHAVALCSECREVQVKTCPDDPEPLCWGCRTRDDILPGLVFKEDHLRGRRPEIVEHQVPIEYVNHGPKRFGTGSGEIESCELVQAMRRDKEDARDASICRRLTLAFCVFEGLLLLGVAALR